MTASMKESAAAPGRRRPRVVWLEDENLLFEMGESLIRTGLREVDLVNFRNGDDAWRDLCREAPDLFITDCCHPGLDGLEILRRLARQGARLPIIWSCGCHSALPIDERALSGLNLALLPKPYTIEEFLEKLGDIVGPCDYARLQQAQSRPFKEVVVDRNRNVSTPPQDEVLTR
jgi:DNA-binding response OmpR family regulator